MPFEGITVSIEEPPLPVIEFEYGSYETEDKFSLMVLLGRTLSADELDTLEDTMCQEWLEDPKDFAERYLSSGDETDNTPTDFQKPRDDNLPS